MVIGYEANPVKKVVAIARITQANDGKAIYFEKVEGLATPIEYLALKECPELEKMEFFVQPNGSLFKLTKGEYDFIMDIIREENPLQKPDLMLAMLKIKSRFPPCRNIRPDLNTESPMDTRPHIL